MKTTLITLLIAALLGLASYASGRSLDAGELISMCFVTGLVAWTATMYRRKPDPLVVSQPIRLPLRSEIHAFTEKPQRLAA